jgi:hypothetical protein
MSEQSRKIANSPRGRRECRIEFSSGKNSLPSCSTWQSNPLCEQVGRVFCQKNAARGLNALEGRDLGTKGRAKSPSARSRPASTSNTVSQSDSLGMASTKKMKLASDNTSPQRPDRSDRIGHRFALRCQDIDLSQLRNDLFRLVVLPRHFGPPVCLKT